MSDVLPEKLHDVHRRIMAAGGAVQLRAWCDQPPKVREHWGHIAAEARRHVRQEVFSRLADLIAEFGLEQGVAMLEEALFEAPVDPDGRPIRLSPPTETR